MPETNQPVSIAHLLDLVRDEYAAWQAVVTDAGPERLNIPLSPGGWSIKDHIAHIAWFEHEMVRLIETRSLASGSPLWYRSTDERNTIIYEENRARPVEEVLREAEEIHARLVALFETLDDQDLFDPDRFSAMPADWQPWIVFAGNTYDHYRDHGESVIRLLI